jgi:hypothetical protein
MTDKNLCEVVVILDRSGSMSTIKDDMEGGFKTFVKQQRELPGRCLVSLYQFDDRYEVCFEERDVREVTDLGLLPRGSTALLDAVGKTVVSVGERLAKKPEHERPGAVVVVIVTDGQENASHEYSRERVKQLIETQQNDYAWKFLYLGADASAFSEAHSMGIHQNAVAQYDCMTSEGAFAASANAVGTYRTATSQGKGADWEAAFGGVVDAEGNIVKPADDEGRP